MTVCGCAATRSTPASPPAGVSQTDEAAEDRSRSSAGTRATAIDPGIELPDGPGREILLGACLACHNLGGLALFKGFYTRDSWRNLVLTMQANGARVDADEIEALSDYLALHFGPAPPPAAD